MMGALGMVAKARSKTVTGRKGEVIAGKKGEKGRFVTLKSGRVIFIPATGGTKWADVRDKVLASQKRKTGRKVGLVEGAVEGGFGDPEAITKEEDIGRGVTDPTLVEFADGSAGVHKYNEAVLDTYGNPVGEVLAYEISQAMGGLGNVPDTIAWWRGYSTEELRGLWEEQRGGYPTFDEFEREFGDWKRGGTLQEHIYESWTWSEMIDRRDHEQYALAPETAVLDAILGNRDRHGGNILEDAYGQVYAIDNNGAFGFGHAGEPQDYGSAESAVVDILGALNGLDADNPGRFMYAMDGYKEALGRVEEFSRSPKFKRLSDKIRNTIDDATADQFEYNVNYMARMREAEAKVPVGGRWETGPGGGRRFVPPTGQMETRKPWGELVRSYDELYEESGGDYDHWGEWD